MLTGCYTATGLRAFDATSWPPRVRRADRGPGGEEAAPAHETQKPLGRHTQGCRIGFDLGGSDRKAAAVVDGKVIFSDEVKWNPYFEKDPTYHLDGVNDSIRRAAAHLPRIDAIGGSAAGVYVNSEPRVGSLYRGSRSRTSTATSGACSAPSRTGGAACPSRWSTTAR